MALIETRGLTKLYKMGDSIVRALDGVDLPIARGEFIAITGASGSGKSTLMHLLGCLDRPTSGQFLFNDRDVSSMSDRQLADIRNRDIGFVFQTFNLINRMSALENVAIPLFYARKGNARGPARRALERVGLAERATHKSNELSGGERQRVAIARAIVNDPPLLMADEPTGNLDSRTGQQIMEVFRGLNEQGVTIVIVTHEYDVAIQARRIVQMCDGRIVFDRPTDEVRDTAQPALQKRAIAAEPIAIARPAVEADTVPIATSVAPPAAETAPQLTTAELGPVRNGSGTTAALVLGVLAAFLAALSLSLFQFMSYNLKQSGVDLTGLTPEEIQRQLPPGYIAQLLIAALSMVASFVLGIIAIVVGWRALRRMRRELGNWRGHGRAWVGLILGWAVVLAPFLVKGIGYVTARASGGSGGG
ncbi:MAG: ATP-binding cassette domain-containing protein [Planctomycetota bacterium]